MNLRRDVFRPCNILGVIAILLPGFLFMKELAYAGFFFIMSVAVYSHLFVGDETMKLFGPSLLFILTVLTGYYRLENRRIYSLSIAIYEVH